MTGFARANLDEKIRWFGFHISLLPEGVALALGWVIVCLQKFVL